MQKRNEMRERKNTLSWFVNYFQEVLQEQHFASTRKCDFKQKVILLIFFQVGHILYTTFELSPKYEKVGGEETRKRKM